jgi:GTP-binding protein
MYNDKTIVAIVGRPNVGKSTLFNKIIKKRIAIVSDYAGVTRDRNYACINYNEKEFILVDTGGFIEENLTLQNELNNQTKTAINESDIIVFVVDAKSGLNPDDKVFAEYLRKVGKLVLLVANKAETEKNKLRSQEFHELGLGEPFVIAAEHNQNINNLKDEIISHINKPDSISLNSSNRITFAIIGKPNTGKSTLTNKLIGDDQIITSDIAGTTRDSIALDLTYNGVDYTIVDTAGIRRKTKIKNEIEKFSVIRSLNAISNSHVVLYLIAANEDISDQDYKLINFIIDEGRALVIAINKCDLLNKKELKEVNDRIKEKLEFASFAPIINISGARGHGIKTLWRMVYSSYKSAMQKFSTKQLTEILKAATTKNPPPLISGRNSKMQLAHPGGTNPPTIIIHGKQTNKITSQYKRYLEKYFYKKLALTGTPLKIFFKTTENPYFSGK